MNGREKLEVAAEEYVTFSDLCMQWGKLIKTFLSLQVECIFQG